MRAEFEDKEWDGNHLHYFNIESIKRICKKNDLRVLAIKPVGNFLFLNIPDHVQKVLYF